MEKVFPIVPAPSGTRWVVILLAAIEFAGAAVIGSLAFGASAHRLPPALPMILLAILPLCGLLFLSLGYSMRHVTFVLSDRDFCIRGDFLGRVIPRSSLLGDRAKIVNLNVDTAYQPWLRTFGTGLPGYLAGWFRLRSRQKALVFVTDRSQVLYLPTSSGYVLLLSAARPDECLAALRSSSASSA